MKSKNIILVAVFSLFLLSCSKSDDNDPKQDSQFIVHPDSEIQISETDERRSLEIVAGDKFVFEYTFDDPGDPDLADSGFAHYLYFEIDKSTQDFSFGPEDFESIQANFRRSCFCVYTDFRKIKNGKITGVKTGDRSWKVTFDVNTEIEEEEELVTTIAMKNSGTFRLID